MPQIYPAGEHAVLIPTAEEGQLECMISVPKTITTRNVAIICHPHPLFEGTLHNKVVHTVAKTFRNLGGIAVRFNFRGVGKSSGSYAEGIGETDDLKSVYEWVQHNLACDGIFLSGFSFGSFVAYRFASLYQDSYPLQQLISIAPPVERFNFAEVGINVPWLLIQGDADEVVSSQAVFDWVKTLVNPPQLIELKGVGHFFHGQLITLEQLIRDNLAASF